jgi:hypothetical protein
MSRERVELLIESDRFEMKDFSDFVSKIPSYDHYLTVDELDANSEKLAQECKDTVRLHRLGKTKNGHDIIALQIGRGKHSALVHAFPNPEEPLGGLVLDYFSETLAKDESILRKLDYTWYIIKCIDPDGAKLTQGALKGDFTPYDVALNYYRTPVFDTGEENFPYRYGDVLDLNKPTPETLALMKIMTGKSFDFVSSLHNMAVCGTTFQVCEPCPQLYASLQQSAKKNNVPLRRRTGFMLAPGVQLAGYMTPALNYIRLANLDKSPIQKITGAYIFEYARLTNPRVFMMIPEGGVWYEPRLYDENLTGSEYKTAFDNAMLVAKETAKSFVENYKIVKPMLDEKSPFRIMLDDSIDAITNPTINVIDPDPEIPEQIQKKETTVAQKVETEVQMEIRRLFRYGSLIHALNYEMDNGRGKSKHSQVANDLKNELDSYNRSLNSNYRIDNYPRRSLVATNLESILLAAEYAAQRAELESSTFTFGL